MAILCSAERPRSPKASESPRTRRRPPVSVTRASAEADDAAACTRTPQCTGVEASRPAARASSAGTAPSAKSRSTSSGPAERSTIPE